MISSHTHHFGIVITTRHSSRIYYATK